MPASSSSSPARLKTLLDCAQRPVYCVDSQRRIVYCNQALVAWLGMATEEVVGRLVEYHSNPSTEATNKTANAEPLFGLCPPPQSLASESLAGEECLGTVTSSDPSGRLLHRRGRFVPLGDSASSSSGQSSSNQSSSNQSVLVILDQRDLSAAELVESHGSESSSGDLHRALRQFHRNQLARFSPQSLIGRSSAIGKVRAQVHAAAASRANAVVAGPAGCGRSHVAKTIHYLACGDQSGTLIPLEGPFVTLESFRQSWTRLHEPSSAQRPGTLLISDADRLAPEVLGLLEEALKTNTGHVQILVTSGDDMGQNVLQVLDQLATITIAMPPLNRRIDDLPLLAQMFLESCNQGSAKQIGGLSPETLDLLALYQWPGQLDELQQVVQAAHEKCSGYEISVSDLPAVIHHAASHASLPEQGVVQIDLDRFLGQIEKELIERALREAKGNKTTAAKLLGLNRPRLYRRLEQLGLLNEE